MFLGGKLLLWRAAATPLMVMPPAGDGANLSIRLAAR